MSKILFVGGFPSDQDLKWGKPLSDNAGIEFYRMLAQAGIDKAETSVINIIQRSFPNNSIDPICVKKEKLSEHNFLPQIRKGFYLPEIHTIAIREMFERVAELSPNVIVPLGAFASWVFSEPVAKHFNFASPISNGMITKIRGQIFNSSDCQIIPTYDPASVLRDWATRPIVVFDLMKIARHKENRQFTPPARQLCLEPTLEEVEEYLTRCEASDLVSFDIETKQKTMTCIGFSADPQSAICIPFYDPRKPDNNYWSLRDEAKVLGLVKKLLESPVPKLAQNGLYDIQYITAYGIRIKNYLHDTMLLHHSLYSEMPKGLAFMASIYTDELAWKFHRNNDDFKAEA